MDVTPTTPQTRRTRARSEAGSSPAKTPAASPKVDAKPARRRKGAAPEAQPVPAEPEVTSDDATRDVNERIVSSPVTNSRIGSKPSGASVGLTELRFGLHSSAGLDATVASSKQVLARRPLHARSNPRQAG
jgi:hypothetical protein